MTSDVGIIYLYYIYLIIFLLKTLFHRHTPKMNSIPEKSGKGNSKLYAVFWLIISLPTNWFRFFGVSVFQCGQTLHKQRWGGFHQKVLTEQML